MGRTLALLLFLLPALAQTPNCDATEVRFDFSAPGSLGFLNGYPIANQAGYLHLLDVGSPLRFLPTLVVGGTQPQRVVCTVTTPNGGGGGGTLCGVGTTRCLRLSGVVGTLPAPLNANTRLLVQVQVVSGNATSHAPSPTPLGNLPDTRGLASIARNTTAVLWIWFYLEMDPDDAFPALPATGTLTLTYRLQNN